MHLAQLRALVAVADRGGFTRAAAELGLTQSAVSHAVAALERELGQRLVDRDRVGAVLTAAGKAVVDDAREAVRAADRVAERAAASAGELVGELRLGGMPSTNLAVLPALQRRFARRHPEHPLAGEAAVGVEELLDDAFVTSKSGCEPLVESIFAGHGLVFRPTH